MIKPVFRLTFLLALGLTALFTACEKEAATTSEEVDNYVIESVFGLETSARCGKHGCFEFVFPLTIAFPDETTAEVEDYQGLRTAIREWRQANPDAEGRPELQYPFDVMTEDGELVTIESAEELVELRRSCRRQGPQGPHHDAQPCFRLQYPVTIAFPDGTTADAAGPRQLKNLIREWRRDNPDVEGRPELAFPVTVIFKDATTQEVASAEELRALKDACSTDEE